VLALWLVREREIDCRPAAAREREPDGVREAAAA
jgi:hypothetical protein